MIIAIKDVDKVVIAYANADYASSLAEEDYIDEENLPLKFSDKGNAFLTTTLKRSSDIILYNDELINSEMNAKIIIKDVIPYLKYAFKENGGIIDGDGDWDNSLVICNDNHIYDIAIDFTFREREEYAYHGYFHDMAVSVLDANASLPPKERILKTVDYVCKMQKCNFYPLIITDTKSKRIEVIRKEVN